MDELADVFVDISVLDARASSPVAPRTSWPARAGALAVLAGLLAVVVLSGRTAYWAIKDSFVSPMIMSPDSDMVLSHRQKVMELDVERSIAQAQAEGVDGDLIAIDQAEQRLGQMQRLASHALSFTSQSNSQQVNASTTELGTLAEQRELLTRIAAQQRIATERVRTNYASGLATQVDYDRERQAQAQADINLLENTRGRARAEAQIGQVTLSQNSINHNGAPPLPELIAREAQLVQLQLEIFRLRAEKRSKTAERRVLAEKISKIGDLQAQLKSRPIFQAIERSLYAAFVPYNQLDGVVAGAAVYECTWGIFQCTSVGRVAEVVSGEVSTTDPWGNVARGQYILLDLSHPKAATAKVLRVRGGVSA